MTYKNFSQTTSGWSIDTDPEAPRDRQWRIEHEEWGTQFFTTHDEAIKEAFRISIGKMREMFEKLRFK